MALILLAYAAGVGTLGARMLNRRTRPVGCRDRPTVLIAAGQLRAAGRQARRHAQTARLVGRPEPALDAVLVEHSQL